LLLDVHLIKFHFI